MIRICFELVNNWCKRDGSFEETFFTRVKNNTYLFMKGRWSGTLIIVLERMRGRRKLRQIRVSFQSLLLNNTQTLHHYPCPAIGFICHLYLSFCLMEEMPCWSSEILLILSCLEQQYFLLFR